MIKSRKWLNIISNSLIYLILIVLTIIWLLPIFWLVLQSFRLESGSVSRFFIPLGYTLDNYTRLFIFDPSDQVKFTVWFMNTLTIAAVTCVISTVLVLMTSYAFSRLRFKLRRPMMQIILILGLFPGFMSMIAIYHILKLINLVGSIWGLVLVYSGGAAMGYYISKGFFDTIPKAIDEAAMIDGASKSQIFWRITLPLSRPIIIFTILTSFIAPWGDFIFARLILGDRIDSFTVARGLYWMLLRENISAYFTRFSAGAVIVAIPTTILFVFLQRYYVTGVTGGSVKG
jgi:arabinogalactan oligomer/maltooligosaccharide transport system permease protein